MMTNRKEEVVAPYLGQLLEQSKQLAHPMLIGQELPAIERSVENVEMLSRKLAKKSAKQVSIIDSTSEDAKMRESDKIKG
jgi:hypothetical protein